MKRTDFNIFQALQKFYPLILLVVIVWACWLLARGFWLVIAPPAAPALSPVPLQNSQMAMPVGNGLDIFARPMATQSSLPPPDVKIVGITVANPKSLSFAILTFNGKTKSYKVDEILDGSAFKLSDVKIDHIILTDNNGQTFKVDFGKPFLLDQRGQQPQQAMRTQGNTMVLNNESLSAQNMPQVMPPSQGMPVPQIPTQTPPPMPNQPLDGTSPTQAQNTPTPLDNAIEGLQANPAGYLSQMGVAATGNGYMVTDAMPSGMKDRLGLQTGDRVISLNGQNVGQNPAQDSQLLQQARQSGQAQIQVQRGEQVITLNQSF